LVCVRVKPRDTDSAEQGDDSWGFVSDANHNDFHRSIGQQSSGLLNLGTSNSSSNRSLGSFNDTQDIVFALVFRNDSTTTFTNFALSYFGEQWQVNSLSGHPSMKLDYTFGVFPSFSDGTTGAVDPDVNPNTVVPYDSGNPDQFGRFNEGGGTQRAHFPRE